MPFLSELGADSGDFILKSDGEAAMKAVLGDVASLRPPVRTIREETPRGSRGSNGAVERAIQSVIDPAHVLKYCMDDKRCRKILDEGPVLQWAAGYMAVLLNRCEVSFDGFTAHRRLRGKGGAARGSQARATWRSVDGDSEGPDAEAVEGGGSCVLGARVALGG